MTVWYADGTSKPSLVASHTGGFRRIWDFPADWAQLGDSELALSSRSRRRRARAGLYSRTPQPAESRTSGAPEKVPVTLTVAEASALLAVTVNVPQATRRCRS